MVTKTHKDPSSHKDALGQKRLNTVEIRFEAHIDFSEVATCIRISVESEKKMFWFRIKAHLDFLSIQTSNRKKSITSPTRIEA